MEKQREAVLCFVIYKDKVLMINRNKPPFMGMWNAIGGKVEDGETPFSACIREVKEESGISICLPQLLSTFTWNYDNEVGYAFTYYLNNLENVFPIKTDEGIIDLKDISWILNAKNYGVIEDLRIFISDIQKGTKHDYHLVYDNSKLIDVIVKK